MNFLRSLLTNHPLANIAFVVVVLLGLLSYLSMPREQDPEINFNWVTITTTLPGASAEDIEQLVTNPLEDAIAGVSDVRFVTSTSRETISSILVRFHEISPRVFSQRMNDLRREIQNAATAELPPEANDPHVMEITSSSGFPTATVQLIGLANDETLRLNARRIQSDMERITGIDQVFASGLRDPVIRVSPDPMALAAHQLTATDVSDALRLWWRDSAAGTLRTDGGAWSVSVRGVVLDPSELASLPVAAAGRPGVSVRLGDVARIERDRALAAQLASVNGQPAISMPFTKTAGTNTLELVDRVNAYIAAQNPTLALYGLRLELSDDQTVPTREAISIMQTNALYGMLLVLAVCWLFLGSRIGALVALGIPFSLFGTFALLAPLGHTVNISVLLGVVIALGMLVDNAVVVAESIYYRMERGQKALQASLDGIGEVWKPVLASVATTMAAFMPLMLLPGIVGDFMFIIPFVVTLALAISLIAAFWMLPVHVQLVGGRFERPPSRVQRWRNAFNRGLRLRYTQWLAFVLRRPKRFSALALAVIGLAVLLYAVGVVRVQFFAFDPIRAFYVNVDMPANATLEQTMAVTEQVEQAVRARLQGVGPAEEGHEARSVSSTAGLMFTDTEPVYGDNFGQIFVSLNPRTGDAREVQEVVDAMRADIEGMDTPGEQSFFIFTGGPPTGMPINIRVRGDDFDEIQRAAEAIKELVRAIPGTQDVQDDNLPGRPLLQLRLNHEAMRELGLNAQQVTRLVRLAVDGETVAFTRLQGDRIELKVRSSSALGLRPDPDALLNEPVALPNGQIARLGTLVEVQVSPGRGAIRHFNLRRAITVQANLDRELTDTREANLQVKAGWERIRTQHPGVDLDFTGELEDIEESLDAMGVLFLFGIGLIYLILAAQFRSYFQPLMVLVAVPLAFAGVAFGLALSGNPLSLFTMYGVIALGGIAVNSAIVLIDAANNRLRAGMSVLHATLYAARRRLVPVLITSSTTIGGLASLAFGLGGESLLWGPVAASIVYGLAFSTVLTLFVVPLLYHAFMRYSPLSRAGAAGPAQA